jgi:hypothetical protein
MLIKEFLKKSFKKHIFLFFSFNGMYLPGAQGNLHIKPWRPEFRAERVDLVPQTRAPQLALGGHQAQDNNKRFYKTRENENSRPLQTFRWKPKPGLIL